jgi:Tfp pilus assembly protein PilF
MRIVMATVLSVALIGGAAQAQDRTGYQAIAAGDLSAAEQRLERELRIFPDRPELMLNMAAVYGRTGRAAEARALYASVLDRPATMMDMPDGAVRSSHELASTGLARFSSFASAR